MRCPDLSSGARTRPQRCRDCGLGDQAMLTATSPSPQSRQRCGRVRAPELRSGHLIGQALRVWRQEARASLITDTWQRVPTRCLRLRMMFVISSVVGRRRIRKYHIVSDVVVSNAADVERLGIKAREKSRWTCPEIA